MEIPTLLHNSHLARFRDSDYEDWRIFVLINLEARENLH